MAMNFYDELQELKNNPIAILAKYKYNIPQGMTDANQIMQYLLNTGQKSQQDVNNSAQIMQYIFGRK